MITLIQYGNGVKTKFDVPGSTVKVVYVAGSLVTPTATAFESVTLPFAPGLNVPVQINHNADETAQQASVAVTFANLQGVPGDNTALANALAAATPANDSIDAAKLASNAVTTVKVQDKAITKAKMEDMATSTVRGRLTAGTGVPEDLTLTALAAALGIVAGGVGQMRVIKRTAAMNTIAVSTTRGESTRLTIPAGLVGTHGMVVVTFSGTKSGATDSVNATIHLGSINSTNNQVDGFNFAGTNVGFTGQLILMGNGVDQSSVRVINPNAPAATGTATAANTLNFTINTANAWDIILAFTTSTTDTAAATYMGATLVNPDLASAAATFTNIGGVAGDNASLVALIDPGTSTEAAGRALTQADNGKTLVYTGAGAGSFTVPNTLTAPFSCEVVQNAAGVPTFVSDGTSVIRVPTGKSASAASQYDAVAIQLLSTGPVTVRVV